MYLHLGRDYVVNSRDVIGIFDMDTTTISPRGRAFLDYNQKNGAVVALSEDIPSGWDVQVEQAPCGSLLQEKLVTVSFENQSWSFYYAGKGLESK